MHGIDFIKYCETAVAKWFSDHPEYDWNGAVFTVSYYKELRNSKGTFAGGGKNQVLFEITYNGAEDELYFNVYNKIDSHVE